MATTKTSQPAPASSPTTSSLYDAVERLRDQMNATFESTLLGNGDLLQLRDELGEVRDNADRLQSAVMGFISSINEYL